MPWILLEKGTLPARRTVLLDYISANIISALIKSLRAKDFVVTIALAGTILNKILVVLSTSLFVLTDIKITVTPESLTGGRAFEPAGYNASAISQSFAARIFSLESQGMQYPVGTTHDYATEIPPHMLGKIIHGVLCQTDTIFDCEQRAISKIIMPRSGSYLATSIASSPM